MQNLLNRQEIERIPPPSASALADQDCPPPHITETNENSEFSRRALAHPLDAKGDGKKGVSLTIGSGVGHRQAPAEAYHRQVDNSRVKCENPVPETVRAVSQDEMLGWRDESAARWRWSRDRDLRRRELQWSQFSSRGVLALEFNEGA